VQAVVRQLDVGQRGLRGLAALQRVGHAGHEQPVLDGVEPAGALGVARPHLVQPAVAVGKITRLAHCLDSPPENLG